MVISRQSPRDPAIIEKARAGEGHIKNRTDEQPDWFSSFYRSVFVCIEYIYIIYRL